MIDQVIQEKLEGLPPGIKQEALDYIEFLASKYQSSSNNDSFEFDWAGALEKMKNQYSSVELQHKVLEFY